MTKNKKKILIVEDYPIFRWGLSGLINQEPDLVVCGDATDASEACQAIEDLKPDLIIADFTLKSSDGIDWTKEVNRRDNVIAVPILSMHDQFLYAERALHAGARGYIRKQEAMENVVTAIRQVLAEKVYLQEQIKDQILFNLADYPPGSGRSPLARLTNRKLEVLRRIGKGLSTREIASKLHSGLKTIGTYRERIREKLHLKHANELVRHAVHCGKTGEMPAGAEN